jgi:predicted PurR-regulated permease PerM
VIDTPAPASEADPKLAPEASVSAWAPDRRQDSAAVAVRTFRFSRMMVAVGALAVIAVVAALYLARAFFVPLLLGILASYALSPVVDWLKLCRVPRPVGAALVLAVLVGTLSWVAFSVSDDAAAMVEKLPEAARKLRQTLSDVCESGPTALQNMQEVANELQGAAQGRGRETGGVWGLLLGAPLVVIAKVICDRVESLKPAGELLGR